HAGCDFIVRQYVDTLAYGFRADGFALHPVLEYLGDCLRNISEFGLRFMPFDIKKRPALLVKVDQVHCACDERLKSTHEHSLSVRIHAFTELFYTDFKGHVLSIYDGNRLLTH